MENNMKHDSLQVVKNPFEMFVFHLTIYHTFHSSTMAIEGTLFTVDVPLETSISVVDFPPCHV